MPIQKGNGEWARSNFDKAKVFGLNLKNVFKLHSPDTRSASFYNQVERELVASFQMSHLIKPSSPA